MEIWDSVRQLNVNIKQSKHFVFQKLDEEIIAHIAILIVESWSI